MCSASDTRHSPKAYAKRWSRSFRASSSKKTSPRHFLAVLRPRLSQQRERAMRISAPISSATTSGAIFTSRSRIHLFRIRRSAKSRLPRGSKAGESEGKRGASLRAPPASVCEGGWPTESPTCRSQSEQQDCAGCRIPCDSSFLHSFIFKGADFESVRSEHETPHLPVKKSRPPAPQPSLRPVVLAYPLPYATQ